jgi:hypothetical protein
MAVEEWRSLESVGSVGSLVFYKLSEAPKLSKLPKLYFSPLSTFTLIIKKFPLETSNNALACAFSEVLG